MAKGTDELKELEELTERRANKKSSNSSSDEPTATEDSVEDPPTLRTSEFKELSYEERMEGTIEGDKTWAVHGTSYVPCDHSVKQLPAGQYEPAYSDSYGYHMHKRYSNFDALLRFEDSVSDEIIINIEEFWAKEDDFRRFGFLWKRGILLWGPPGGGKTSTLQLIDQKLIALGGISVFITHPTTAAKSLARLRRVEPNRPIVANLEDIDAIQQQHGESRVLALLDGELQIDNIVFIATTNYPENLDDRIVNRPSRFDVVRKIGMPSPGARAMYLGTKNDRLLDVKCEGELEDWVRGTNGFSIAHLKELILQVEVFNKPLDYSIRRLRAMMNYHPKSTDNDDKVSMGFVKGENTVEEAPTR